jgi:probable biosynthetic protein (TIGR04098 family)
MTLVRTFTAGLPHLDIHTLAEDWALAFALEGTWTLLAESLGKPPAQWRDGQGVRMYGAVMALETHVDLAHPVQEDDLVTAETTLTAIRKPHAIGVTRFLVGGTVRLEARLLTSFIRRDTAGSNKKFSKVRDIWQAEDLAPEAVDDWLNAHHAAKATPLPEAQALAYEVNRLQDFNTADFMYFKNFVRIARAAEWRHGRGGPTRLAASRQAFYYGNVEDGDQVQALIEAPAERMLTALQGPGARTLFLSFTQMEEMAIKPR